MTICQTTAFKEYSVRDAFLLLAAMVLIFILYPLASILLQSHYHGLATNRPAPQFQLLDVNGKTTTLSDFKGKHIYLMFGFLQCQDVCHSQAFLLNSIAGVLPEDDIEFVYLAMDANTDKPSSLEKYFNQRGNNFTSLRADTQQKMQSLATAFNAGFRINGNSDSNNYSIDHPARLFLIDPEGNLRLTYNGMAVDIKQIIDDFYQLNNIPVIREI